MELHRSLKAPSLPLEVVQQILAIALQEGAWQTLCLSKHLHGHLTPGHYQCTQLKSLAALEQFHEAIRKNSRLREHVRAFAFKGTQGREQPILDDEEREWELESGVEGVGHVATFDVHERTLETLRSTLHLISPYVQKIMILDSVPWYDLPPSRAQHYNFAHNIELTGPLGGVFGLASFLRPISPDSLSYPRLSSIHLLGGDPNSWALTSLMWNSSSASVRRLHITAPTLYRKEFWDKLTQSCERLLRGFENLEELCVGFVRQYRAVAEGNACPDNRPFQLAAGRRLRLIPLPLNETQLQCRQAYLQALPRSVSAFVSRTMASRDARGLDAILPSVADRPSAHFKMRQCGLELSVKELPFVQGQSCTTFADWMLDRGGCQASPMMGEGIAMCRADGGPAFGFRGCPDLGKWQWDGIGELQTLIQPACDRD